MLLCALLLPLLTCTALFASPLLCDNKFADAFLTNVTTGLPVESRDGFCDREGFNVLTVPEDTGIVHYVLTGSIATDKLSKQHGQYNTLYLGEVAPLNVAQIPVSLHLWVRTLCTKSTVTIRGYGMLQEVHPLQKANGQVQLEFQLTSLTPTHSAKQHLFDVYWREEEECTRFNSPFTIETSLPFRDLAEHYMLHVGGFRQHVIYSPKVHNCHPVFSRKTPVLLTVIPHSHTGAEDPARIELTTRMITAQVKHHIMLGLAGTIHYNVEPFLTHLSQDPGIQALIVQGNLRLIKWDSEVQGYNPNGLVWHKNRAKTLQYNHAILSHWGLDIYLNPMDIDEFMASREPFKVADLLADQRLVPGGQTKLYRYDLRCGTCQGQKEADMWLQQSDRNPLMMYNETDWEPRLRGKPIVHADTSFSMSIHESGVFHGGMQQYKGFLFHLHVVNLFRYRLSAAENDRFSADISWDWSIRPDDLRVPV